MADQVSARSRRTLRTLRHHLWVSAAVATLSFALVVSLSFFVPVLLQLAWREPSGAEVRALTDSLRVLSTALWPVVLLSLIASVVTANVLFQRMREPLVRYVRCYESIASGTVPPQLTIRPADYLAEETDALNGMIAALRLQQSLRADAVARLEEAIVDLACRDVPETVLAELQDVAKRLSVPRMDAFRGPSPRG